MQAILPFLEAGTRYVQIHGSNDERQLDELPDASDVDQHDADAEEDLYDATKTPSPGYSRYQQLSQALHRDDPLSPGLIDRVFASPNASNALETAVSRLTSAMEEDTQGVEDIEEDVDDSASHVNVKGRKSFSLTSFCDQNGKIVWTDFTDDETLYFKVSIRERADAFVYHFGTRNTSDPSQRWTIDKVGASFRDLYNNVNERCLNNGKVIESGAGYHCKGGVVACKSCRVALIMKQLGGAMTKKYNEIENGIYETNHYGGISKLLLDIAKKLPISWLDGREEEGFISSLDYRNLDLMVLALTHRASCDNEINISSFTKLWRICQRGLEIGQYLQANKRFIGCLLDIDHGSKTDNVRLDESKPLADLWHPTAVWRNERYLSFTMKYPYGTGNNETDNYNQDVIHDSVLHIKKYEEMYKNLAKSVWEELKTIKRILYSVEKKIKRKNSKRKGETKVTESAKLLRLS